MNLPNKLTVLRVILIPFFFLFYFLEITPFHYFIAFFIFIFASLTDMLDGFLARRWNLVTTFGKLMDPLADKLLVLAAIILILSPGYGAPLLPTVFILPFSWIALFIILGRDLLVNAIRLIAASNGVVIAADWYGKLKTIFQMVWISLCLLLESLTKDTLFAGNTPTVILQVGQYIGFGLFALVLFFTVASGIHYVYKNKQLFLDA